MYHLYVCVYVPHNYQLGCTHFPHNTLSPQCIVGMYRCVCVCVCVCAGHIDIVLKDGCELIDQLLSCYHAEIIDYCYTVVCQRTVTVCIIMDARSA